MISALVSSIITKIGYGPTLGSFIACGKEDHGTVKSGGFLFGENMVSVLTDTDNTD